MAVQEFLKTSTSARRGRRPIPRAIRLRLCIALRENAALVDRRTVKDVAESMGSTESTAYLIQRQLRHLPTSALVEELTAMNSNGPHSLQGVDGGLSSLSTGVVQQNQKNDTTPSPSGEGIPAPDGGK